MHPSILLLTGPTASGKSSLAMRYARECGKKVAIINADAMQLYRGLEVITAQPSAAEQEEIPHYLYGVRDPAEACSVAEWIALATQQIDACHKEGTVPLLVGGTGMYLSSLMKGLATIPTIPDEVRSAARTHHTSLGADAFHAELCRIDPVMGERLHPSDTQRVLRAYEVITHTGHSLSHWQAQPHTPYYPPEMFEPYVVTLPREQLYAQCNARFDAFMEAGALEEVKRLDARNLNPALPALKSLGIPELRAYLHGELTLEAATTQAKQSTRNYAKRQMTWFRNQMKGAKEIELSSMNSRIG
jgi:tRNA dimethylallyltransferase